MRSTLAIQKWSILVLNAQFSCLMKSERNLLILTKKKLMLANTKLNYFETLSSSFHFLKTAKLTHKTIATAHRNNVLTEARNSIKNNNY